MIRASDMIGCKVRTASGAKLGRVHDLRAHHTNDGWALVALVVGAGGLRNRLAGGDGGSEATRSGDLIAWDAVLELGDGIVTVRDGTTPGAPPPHDLR